MPNFITNNIQTTKKNFDTELKTDKNFDIICKEMKIGGKKSYVYFVNGFIKEDILEKLQEFFADITDSDMPKNANDFIIEKVTFGEVTSSKDKEDIIIDILSGQACLLVEGYDVAILIDCRSYPARNVSEPEKYKVLRGSRDGFVETLVNNVALIRRRIRSTDFICEVYKVGKSSKTDVSICYMESRVDHNMLSSLRDKIKNIDTDALTMNQQSLAESIYKGNWFNPFPKFKFSERPDSVSASILEGHIAVMVDNSPSAMVLPTTIFDVIEEADDYYFPPVTGTYLRLSRTLLTIVALFLTPVFLLLMQNPDIVPEYLQFVIIQEDMKIPLLLQLLMLEIAVDGLKLAAINTPTMLNTPLSLIAAVVIGDYAVDTGWFNFQTMLYMAIVAIANFTHENYELSYAIKFMRIIILLLTSIFNKVGFAIGCLIVVLCLVRNKTIAGKPYLYPLIPFDGKKLAMRFFRMSLTSKEKRNKNAR